MAFDLTRRLLLSFTALGTALNNWYSTVSGNVNGAAGSAAS